jgi:hypothetical protein
MDRVRSSIADTMPETTERGWSMMSTEDAFGPPYHRTAPQPDDVVHAEPDADDRGGPTDEDDDDAFTLHRPSFGGHRLASSLDFQADPHFSIEATRTPSAQDESVGPDDDVAYASDWEMMPVEDALGPSSRYTADELDSMRRGERHDRIGRGMMAGLSGLGSIVSLIGAARGNYASQGAGQGMVNGSSDQTFDAFDRAKAVADERVGRDDAARQRAEEMAMRDRALSLSEANAESGRRNAQVRLEQEGRIQAREDAEHARRFDPQHPAAQTARQRFESLLASYGPSVGDWSDVVESLPNLGAEDIERNISDLEHRAALGLRRRRGGGGGGPRMIVPGGGAVPTDGSTPQVNPLEAMLRDYAGILGQDPGRYIAYYNSAPRDDQERIRARAETVLAQRGARLAGWEHQGDVAQSQSAMPGYVRVEGAPQLTSAQADEARELASTFENLSVNAQQMEALARRITAAQAAAGGGAFRIASEDIAKANQLQERISAALRILSNYGVPNGDELQRIERLAPTLTTLDGWINAERMYRAMRGVLRDNTRRTLHGRYGYAPAPRGSQR